MSMDVSQFHVVFFEESFERLEDMESSLLNIEQHDDHDTINTLFRAAHSIKGGAGAFGFTAVTEFTHILETLLDEIRNGQRQLTTELTNLLLEAVDVLREMLIAVQNKSEQDETRITAVSQRLQNTLDDEEMAVSPAAQSESVSHIKGWQIDFRPHLHMLQIGNDPIRMFRELEALGELSVTADTSAVPPFADYEPEDSYLHWHLYLEGDAIAETEIDDVFDWIKGDCDLTILPVYDETDTPFIETIKQAVVMNEVQVETEPRQPTSADNNAKTELNSNAKTARASSPADNPTSIRVGTDKVDALINLAGELVITQSMLSQIGETFDEENLPLLLDGLVQLERNTRELQEHIMRIRMLPISFVFNRFPRLIHDLSTKMAKQVELKLSGEQTELDKTVMEKIGDPLIHLLRNALDHGLETPEVRLSAGKSETGIIHLSAYHQGGSIIIEVSDDGMGLDEEKILEKAVERGLSSEGERLSADKLHELIFLPGFSTVENISDISGRGVGMDVVRKNINSLGGSIDVYSERGTGTKFTIRLPLTLAIMDGQVIRIANEKYIIPLVSIIESLEFKQADVKNLTGKGKLFQLRDEYLPIIRLTDIFNLPENDFELEEGVLVIVEGDGQKAGFFIDELLGQQQVVIKSLETNYRKVAGISGATIMGDGAVALIIDVTDVMTLHRHPEMANLNDSGQAALRKT